tara:strand:- start:2355 stop:2891 length:537 start_codon:yes stop_codon:yes gene_type:complete
MAAEMPVSVLLRDGTHAGATTRFGLKAEQLSIQIAKTPIQIPIPQQSPELIDLGIFRPSITISGVIENEPEDAANTSNSPTGTRGCPSFTYSGQTYYFPYKNLLEEHAVTWVASDDTVLQLEVGDVTTPVSTSGTNSSGGGLYHVAIQQCQFTQEPAKEDRWNFTLSFVSMARNDISF